MNRFFARPATILFGAICSITVVVAAIKSDRVATDNDALVVVRPFAAVEEPTDRQRAENESPAAVPVNHNAGHENATEHSNPEHITDVGGQTVERRTSDVVAVPPAQPVGASPSDSSTAKQPLDDPHAVESRLQNIVKYLASDELEGRGPRTAGLDKAAHFIADHFRDLGLKANHFGGSPFQVFSLSSRLALGDMNKLAVIDPAGETQRLELGRDFTPLSLSGSARIDAPLVFAGYGITAPEAGYDDYADFDAAGKAVVLLRHEPRQADTASPLAGAELSPHAYFVSKIENAARHGAAAVIFVTDQHALMSSAHASAESTEPSDLDADRLLAFTVNARIAERRLPVVQCRRDVIDRLLQAAGKPSLEQLEYSIDADWQPRSFDLPGCRAAGEISVVRKGDQFKNVIASLEGHGPAAHETIIVGAHYDHLGRGGMGSLAPWTNEIHNGADDNASGTAVLLEIARQLADRLHRPKRRIVFIAFSAEEMGLIGSEQYVRRPLFSMNETVTMINLDMVGRLRNNRLTINGTGTAAEFDSLISRAGLPYGLNVRRSPGGYGPSDHATFYAHGVPVLHFFTGLHNDYHRPSDDYETLNFDGMRRVAQMASDVVIELAQAEQRPRPTRSDDIAALLGASPRTASRGGNVAFLGVLRVADAPSGGYAVREVVPNSPAEKAGLRAGDFIYEFNGQPIQQPDELVTAVRDRQPGERATIRLLRDNTRLEIDAVLGRR